MIIKNCIKCKSCGDIIISTHRHDFKRCSYGRVAVDGGYDYLKRCFTDSPNDFEELSIQDTPKIKILTIRSEKVVSNTKDNFSHKQPHNKRF